MRIKLFVSAALPLLLCACQHAALDGMPYMGGTDNFGEANRQTMAMQVVDPAPVYDTAVPETYAEHAGQAIERYRTDKVKTPDRVKTTDAGVAEAARDGGK